MKITIRRMKASDLDNVIKLGVQTDELFSDTDSTFIDRDTLRRWARHKYSLLLVAEVGGKFAGFRIAEYHPHLREGYLEMLAVAPEYRRRGIGEKLLEYTLDKFKEWGAVSVWCLTLTTNERALAFYKKHGFGVKRRPFFILHKAL